MKDSRSIGAIAVFSLLFFFGCGKKQDKVIEKNPASMACAELQEDITSLQAMDESLEGQEYVFDDIDDAEFVAFDEDADFLVEDDSDFFDQEELEAFMEEEDFALAWEDADDDLTMVEDDKIEPIHFVYNYDWIEKEDGKKLNALAKKAQELTAKGKTLVLEGHCDTMGSAEVNLPLSERRAQAMKKELVKRGVPADSIQVVARGQECPIVETQESSRSKKIAALAPNRRVEVKVA